MIGFFRRHTVPAYLFLCLIFGGSAQSVWGQLGLQLAAVAIIALAVLAPAARSRTDTFIIVLFLCAAGVVTLQLVPLPPAVWASLPGREVVAEGFRLMNVSMPWVPVSVTPYDTLAGSLFLLPPLAVFIGMTRLGAFTERGGAIALFGGALAGVLLGFAQLATGKFGDSNWYLYDETNIGSAVGFFANRNHMATLLLMALPFAAALFSTSLGDEKKGRAGLAPVTILGGTGVAVILLGLALNGSLAAVALAVPVIAGSVALVRGVGRFRILILGAAAVAVVVGLVFLASSPVQPKLTGEDISSIEGRQQIWATTWQLVTQTWPVGTGFGSFERAYPLAENASAIGKTFINHAHNDYLELALEGGALAVLLLLLFVGWWMWRAVRVFSARVFNPFAGAAVVASGAVLAHSVVDYPMRTTAIAAAFALCTALMAAAAPMSPRRARSSGEATKHVSLG